MNTTFLSETFPFCASSLLGIFLKWWLQTKKLSWLLFITSILLSSQVTEKHLSEARLVQKREPHLFFFFFCDRPHLSQKGWSRHFRAIHAPGRYLSGTRLVKKSERFEGKPTSILRDINHVDPLMARQHLVSDRQQDIFLV